MMHVFFGGSFDPVHEGHLQIVRHVHHVLSATFLPFNVYFLPTAGNPFKGKPTTPIHRLAMLDLAREMLNNEGVFVQICPLEIYQTPPVYTIDTVKLLHKKYPNDQLIFVMGGDSLSSLHRWKDYSELLKLVKIWAILRVDHDVPIADTILPHMSENFDEFLNGHTPIFYDRTPILAISSSAIREALASNDQLTHLPTPILNYIKHHHLYKSMV